MKERQTSTNRKSVKKANKLGRLLLILFLYLPESSAAFFFESATLRPCTAKNTARK